MQTQTIPYSEVKVGDQIFTNGQDNHMFRKLKYLSTEIVKKVFSYESRGAGFLFEITFESGNQTLGIADRNLEKIID